MRRLAERDDKETSRILTRNFFASQFLRLVAAGRHVDQFFSIDRPSHPSFLYGGKILFIRKNFHSIAQPVQYRNLEVFFQIGLMASPTTVSYVLR